MKDKELDNMLYSSLKPEFTPSDKLNRELIDKLKNIDDSNIGGNGDTKAGNGKVINASGLFKSNTPAGIFIKAAAVIIIVFLLGGAGVYAANHFLKKPEVYDHGISVGNQDYVKDEHFTQETPETETKETGHTEGGPDDIWTSKDETVVGGKYHNASYVYPDYESVVSDTKFSDIFDGSIGKTSSAIYSTVEEEGGEYKEEAIDIFFDRGEGVVFLHQDMSEGVAEDAAYSVELPNGTSNSRDYTSKNGLEFTLVDEAKSDDDSVRTYVMLSYDDVSGFMSFDNMTEDEIHECLDMINLDKGEE